MDRRVAILSVCLILAASPAFPWSGECVWVINGDSLLVMHDGKPEQIRLHGISCPKWGQNFALEAAQFTKNMALNQSVEVKPLEKPLGRTFAAVSVDGKSVNEALVKAGLAWWWEHYAPNDANLAEAHVQAMKNKLKIWSDPAPVPPWKYRWKEKAGGSEATEPE